MLKFFWESEKEILWYLNPNLTLTKKDRRTSIICFSPKTNRVGFLFFIFCSPIEVCQRRRFPSNSARASWPTRWLRPKPVLKLRYISRAALSGSSRLAATMVTRFGKYWYSVFIQRGCGSLGTCGQWSLPFTSGVKHIHTHFFEHMQVHTYFFDMDMYIHICMHSEIRRYHCTYLNARGSIMYAWHFTSFTGGKVAWTNAEIRSYKQNGLWTHMVCCAPSQASPWRTSRPWCRGLGLLTLQELGPGLWRRVAGTTWPQRADSFCFRSNLFWSLSFGVPHFQMKCMAQNKGPSVSLA